MKYQIDNTVMIKATGGKGKIDVCIDGGSKERQYRVMLPDGRFGWHYADELDPCELDFEAEQKRFAQAVSLENHLTRMCERPADTGYSFGDDEEPTEEEDSEEE